MRPCLGAVAVVLLLLCSVVTPFADDLTYTGTQCAFDAQGPNGPTCDISPVYVLSKLLTTVPNDFAKLTLQATATEVYCNNLNSSDACAADATCVHNNNTTPACTLNSGTSDSDLTQIMSCPGSPMAAMLPCNWAASSEDDCTAAVARGFNCTWDAGTAECLPAAVAAMSEAELADYAEKYTSWNAILWGDCDNLNAYRSYVSACGTPGDENLTASVCAAYGPSCQWLAEGGCTHTPVATLIAAFGLDASTSPVIAAQAACSAGNATADACAAAGGGASVFVPASLLLAAKNGSLALTSLITNLTDPLPCVTPVAANTSTHTGGARGLAPAANVAFAVLLLVALLL